MTQAWPSNCSIAGTGRINHTHKYASTADRLTIFFLDHTMRNEVAIEMTTPCSQPLKKTPQLDK